MDSLWIERNIGRNSETGGNNIRMETEDSANTPTWRMPISKSVSSALSDRLERLSSESSSNNENVDEEDQEQGRPLDFVKRQGKSDKEDEDTLIQILLPCIICNRTFSPEALERHSKVCTKVNIKTPYKPDRGKFDAAVYRKKGTRLEDFIPPPSLESDNRFLSRGSKNRSSLRGTSCTTRSTISTESLLFGGVNANNTPATPTTPTPFRRQRSISQTRGDRASSKAPSDYPYDDHSEFGSNSEESQTIPDTNLPSYAKPIASTEDCPYCNRAFGLKAYDRHVSYCKEKYVQKQYEIQPVPKEKIEAMERQEIRTKYRPMKGSSSCSSLRSVSPAKDFASMAYKLFGGLRRADGSNNLYNNLTNNFKKSNESLTNSCYGDYSRGMRRPSPSPARIGIGNAMSVTNKINNLLSKTFHQQNNNNTVHPMRINTTSNIPKLTKSSDNLAGMPVGTHYAHVPGSGYGQQSNNFSRNSRSRSSLHKNFFRSKRVEPEGTENTSTMTNSNSSSPLIITPMTFFSKTHKMNSSHHEIPRPKGTTLLTQDTSYDPYEMAAKQLEELLKAQPINKNVNKKTARKLGLEKAFESVGVHSPAFENHNEDEDPIDRKGDGDQFVFDLASGKMDDSYWDEILQKSSAAHQKQQERQQASSETKSQLSDSSMGDNSKSRAMSHISSADSGFSRSEVNDPEFEALESFVSLGDVPQQPNLKGQSRNALSSAHTSLSRIFNRYTTTQPQQQLQPQRSQNQSQNQQSESPMQISPLSSQPQHESWRKESATSSLSSPPAIPGARFCHECGNAYPTGIAKFCPECGEKRVFKP